MVFKVLCLTVLVCALAQAARQADKAHKASISDAKDINSNFGEQIKAILDAKLKFFESFLRPGNKGTVGGGNPHSGADPAAPKFTKDMKKLLEKDNPGVDDLIGLDI
ncbi:uncharacterized protein LOC107037977 [Diachasma alloeum]|uniref:uncharacterized protein LOC107037977 n=1 Tax=Diachasma alloeum TaxID=454923 RepID=UPI0007381C0B|nr:uncharacterized protein LOC107037977 [Diachasma alloeum]